MDESPRDVTPTVSPAARSIRIRRVVKLLVAVDLVVLLLVAAIWAATRSDERENVVNEGLRGSLPPAGVTWPGGLAEEAGIVPGFPTLDQVRGAPSMLVATCTQCPSGDVIGGFLGRLGGDDLPDDAVVVVLALDGDVDAWVDRWGIDGDRIGVHAAASEQAAAAARRTLGIGQVAGEDESGITYLHDSQGVRRSTYFLGQLDREDIAHDLASL